MEARREFYVVTEIWDMNLSSRAQTVFTYLSYCANKNGECYPSMTRIASECGMCENTARKMIKELIEKGFITSRPRMIKTDKGNRQTTNVYRILMERGPVKKIALKDKPKAAAGTTGETQFSAPEKPNEKAPECGVKAKATVTSAQEKEDDAEGLDALLERLGIRELYYDKCAGKAIELAIAELWFAESTRICGDDVNKYRMRRRLQELDIDAIDDVMYSLGAEDIENNTAYLKSCIYNAPMRASARIAMQCASVSRHGAH